MKICIIDGYNIKERLRIETFNVELAYQCFTRVLKEYNEKFDFDVYFSWESLPENLTIYDGIIFTGSDFHPDELIEKEKKLFLKIIKKDILTYGSCWGCQLAALATGGKVDLLQNREQPFAKNVKIVKEDHYIYKNKPKMFDGYASHAAYISHAGDCTVLATNKYTGVQGLSIGSFVGFQYHCEYRIQEAAGFLQIRRPKGISHNIKDYDLDITVKNKHIRQTEIKNWIEKL